MDCHAQYHPRPIGRNNEGKVIVEVAFLELFQQHQSNQFERVHDDLRGIFVDKHCVIIVTTNINSCHLLMNPTRKCILIW